jgi:hypothetical protein
MIMDKGRTYLGVESLPVEQQQRLTKIKLSGNFICGNITTYTSKNIRTLAL